MAITDIIDMNGDPVFELIIDECEAEVQVDNDMAVLICNLPAEPEHDLHYDDTDKIWWKKGEE